MIISHEKVVIPTFALARNPIKKPAIYHVLPRLFNI